MKIKLNGKEKLVEEKLLSKLLEELNIKPNTIAIEINGTILSKEDISSHQLNDGDKVELIRFMGGG